MVSVTNADSYFKSNVLHNDEWFSADLDRKQRSLNNAKNQLYRLYRRYKEDTNPIPEEAVYEQALWLLKIDDTVSKAQQGVRSISVDGMSIQVDRINTLIAPEVINILGRRIGRSV